jgi:hypothetical protein
MCNLQDLGLRQSYVGRLWVLQNCVQFAGVSQPRPIAEGEARGHLKFRRFFFQHTFCNTFLQLTINAFRILVFPNRPFLCFQSTIIDGESEFSASVVGYDPFI